MGTSKDQAFKSAEFLGPDATERIKQTRRLANAANVLASNAPSPEMRASFLESKRHWNMITDEIEREEHRSVE
jgi:hypothetical protein